MDTLQPNTLIRVECDDGWHWKGPFVSDDGTFLTLTDLKTQRRIMLRKETIRRLEVLE